MKKILVFIGTRPEAIKMAPVIKILKNSQKFNLVVCSTGQHQELLNQVLATLNLTPDIELKVMKQGQTLSELTGNLLRDVSNILSSQNPDFVLVHGDTTTAMAAGVASFYQKIPFGHVEAGLRTNNLHSPFPEEFNRKILGSIATLHFSPTEINKQNLISEGVEEEKIYVTGNTVIDALELASQMLTKLEGSGLFKRNELVKRYGFDLDLEPFVLITGHRRENFGDNFTEICEAFRFLADKYSKIHFIYPVHLNPNVQDPVNKYLSGFSNFHLVSPQDYLSFILLMKKSLFIITDSGGIQEEAPSLGKPVIVTRNETERLEGMSAGNSILVGSNKNSIIASVSSLIENQEAYKLMSKKSTLFGDGKASERIVIELEKFLKC